jgi:L-asparaginase
MQRKLLALLVGAAMTFNASAADKPGVAIYATGGTIAGASKSNTDTTDYKPGALGVEVLIKAVPELKDVATVSGEQIANVGSFDMGGEILLKMAKSINAKLAENGIAGVVVTHGTDTTEETAFFLDLTVRSPKPVVVVGAMRPATAISADGPMNLLEAVTLAASPAGQNRGTMVVLNDRIASGFYITKTNSLALDTFRAAEQGYLGAFINGAPKFYFEPARPVGRPSFDVSKIDKLPKVAVLYTHQDSDVDLLDAAVKGGAKGIVIAGVGNGNVPTPVKAKIQQLSAAGIPVVISTRTGSGFVTAKPDGIAAGIYNPQKARILLQLALAQGADLARIRSYFGS